MVWSLPITRKHTMFTTSGMTGLTFPGMIDEPGCLGGRLISRRPQRGPDERSLRSLQTFESLIARLFMHDEYRTYACVSCVASMRSGASRIGNPVIFARCFVHFSA